MKGPLGIAHPDTPSHTIILMQLASKTKAIVRRTSISRNQVEDCFRELRLRDKGKERRLECSSNTRNVVSEAPRFVQRWWRENARLPGHADGLKLDSYVVLK